MKRSFKNLLVFFIGFLAIAFIIQTVSYKLIINLKIGEIGVINKIVAGDINSDIIICGASRSYVGINPLILEQETGLSCYNISLNGSRLGSQIPLLKTYLKYNKKPKIIIQELGMYSLTFDERLYAPFKFLPYLSEEILYEGLKKVDSELWLNKYLPIANLPYFNTELQKLLLKDYNLQLNNKPDYLIKGYHPNSAEWSIDESGFYNNPTGIYNKIEIKAIQVLNELVELCREENIKLIFVNTPEYYKILPLYKYRIDKIEHFKKVASDNNLIYKDYTMHKMCNNKNYFYNFTHLNETGANTFSKLLVNDILTN